MTHTTSPAARVTVPRFYATGACAPPVPDRVLREAHADVSVAITLAVEALRARTFGQDARAALLLGYAEAGLFFAPGTDARLCRAELAALRNALIGVDVDAGLAGDSWSSTVADYRARAGVRAEAVGIQLREPHPLLLEWLLDRRAAPPWSILHAEALVDVREHLLSYGIDPTDAVVLEAIAARRRAGEGVPEKRPQGYAVYGGFLLGESGLYLHPDMTSPLAELLDASTPLSRTETELLDRARGLDLAAQAPVWVAMLVQLLDGWIARIPAGV